MSHRKIKLIANPGAGRGKAALTAFSAAQLFKAHGMAADLEFTRGPNDAARIAREASSSYDVIVAVGGDGTVNEIIPGLVFSNLPLGIVPAGSGNDFIKALNIPNDVKKAVEIVLCGTTKTIDLGRMNGRYFSNAAGIGFDAAVNQASYGINHSKKGFILYFVALLKTLGKYHPSPMGVTIGNEAQKGDLFLLTVGNGTTVGGGFRLTPHAKLDDGMLDITLVKPIALLPLLWHLPKVFVGTLDKVTRYVTTTRTSKLTVERTPGVPVHLDGEIYIGDETVLEFEVVTKALTVIGNF